MSPDNGPDWMAVVRRLTQEREALREALLNLRTRDDPDCWCPANHRHGRVIHSHEHSTECEIARAAISKARGGV